MHNDSIGGQAEPVKDRLDLALEYLEMGLSIIPLRPASKLPLGPWDEYTRRKPTVEEVTRWFKGTKNNIAIVCGAVSGVAVVDCDSMESLALVQQKYPSHQRTRTTKGEHFFFKHPGVTVRNSVNLHGIKLDIRGDGGYVVAPGSLHPDGPTYQRSGVWGPVSELPEFPQDILKVKDTVDDAIRLYLDGVGPAIQGESGDAKTFQVACRLVRGFALSDEKALEFLKLWNEGCQPKWSEGDLKEKIRSAKKSGSEVIGLYAEQASQEWRTNLLLDKKGKLIKHPANLEVIFNNDARLKGTLSVNELDKGIHWRGEPVQESFAQDVYTEFCRHWGTVFGREDVLGAAMAAAYRNPFNPLKEMLFNLPAWDGVPRIKTIIPDILKAEDTELHQAMIRAFLIGAVRRILKPGCKLDTALVLVGKQGIGKSTFFRILGGEFFTDTPIDTDSKDRFLVVHRSWILELAELDGMTSMKAAQHIKGLLSSAVDTFRPPYGRTIVTAPRSCVMVGTTNSPMFLMDPTGSRRFWPIELFGEVETVLLANMRDQIIAEAVALEASGEPHWLPADLEVSREDGNERFTVRDPWEDMVLQAFRTLSDRGDVLLDGVGTKELMDAMDLPANTRTRGAEMRLATLLKSLGWVPKRGFRGDNRIRLWFPEGGFQAPVAPPAPY